LVASLPVITNHAVSCCIVFRCYLFFFLFLFLLLLLLLLFLFIFLACLFHIRYSTVIVPGINIWILTHDGQFLYYVRLWNLCLFYALIVYFVFIISLSGIKIWIRMGNFCIYFYLCFVLKFCLCFYLFMFRFEILFMFVFYIHYLTLIISGINFWILISNLFIYVCFVFFFRVFVNVFVFLHVWRSLTFITFGMKIFDPNGY
jgi:hypothetical protein